MEPDRPSRKKLFIVLVTVVAACLAVSAIEPYDLLTWFLEVAPVLIAAPLLYFTYRRFPLTSLAYILITTHALILILGGHYTYARVPIGDWFSELVGWQRNCYDRFAHFVQGFVPALLIREILLRTSPLRSGKWLFVIVCMMALAISALYELTEWAAAIALGQGADEFLGTQGDQWDTQWDMFLALLGSIAGQLTLSAMQDRQIKAVAGESVATQ